MSVRYQVEARYVRALFAVLGRMLVACAAADPEIQRELSVFPEGTVVGFSVLGEPTLRLRVRVHSGRLTRAPRDARPDLEVVFKHVSHAFALLSLQENTSDAYARGRMITQGDVALTIRFTRCLERAQTVMLPGFLAARAVKDAPPIPLTTRAALTSKTVWGIARGLLTRSSV